MSKRDDDSQADMEVGMTTAERRRRRRRGAGLRVPSDNVPRRTSTPPVVAPVPEDPALAISVAYSFSPDSSEPIAIASRETIPSFEHRDGMTTVIDPVETPEPSDFDMKTREMPAVDIEALGLSEAAVGASLPIQRLSSPGLDVSALLSPAELAVRFAKRDATELEDDVEVDLDPSVDAADDGVIDAGSTLDQESGRAIASSVTDLDLDADAAEATTIHPGPPIADAAAASSAGEGSAPRPAAGESAAPRPAAGESSAPRPVATETSGPHPRPPSGPLPIPSISPGGFRTSRAQTVALSEDDLEEVREAARMASQPPAPPPRPASMSIPPPMPPARPTRPRMATPAEEIDITAFDDKATEASGEFEVDVDGIVDAKPDADSRPIEVKLEPAPPPTPALLAPAGPPAPPAVPPAPPIFSEPRSRPISPAPIHGQPMSLPPIGPRDSQPMGIVRELPVTPPPMPPALHKAPPTPPPAKKDKPAPATAPAISKPELRDGKLDQRDGKPRGKPWFVDLFDEDYLRTLPFLTPQATQAEAEFVIDAMALTPGAQVLDVGCGYGRHAMELAARGFHIVGLDLSTPLLVRGGEEAHRRGLTINFVRGDMRELDFDAQFDGAYCLFSTFGYFDDETNKKTVANIARALRPGGRMLIEILNRDYVIADLPTRVWWEGDGCVVLEEVELNYFSSRIQVNRSVVFDDGRQLEQEISVRAYSLHEIGKLMHSAGLRVLEVSGAYHTRGRFFGNQSRHIIVLAERKDPSAA